MGLMTRHVPTEFGFNDLHGSLGKATLLLDGHKNTRVGFPPTRSKTIRTLPTNISETMESYRRLLSSVFNDGIVNIGRIHVVLMLTVYVARNDPTRSKDYWSVFYDIFMHVSDADKIIRSSRNGKLLSVSCQWRFPAHTLNKTAGDFIVKLPRRYRLDDSWECASDMSSKCRCHFLKSGTYGIHCLFLKSKTSIEPIFGENEGCNINDRIWIDWAWDFCLLWIFESVSTRLFVLWYNKAD
jgi:hypothetical protein